VLCVCAVCMLCVRVLCARELCMRVVWACAVWVWCVRCVPGASGMCASMCIADTNILNVMNKLEVVS
jgi:hypothetical protein